MALHTPHGARALFTDRRTETHGNPQADPYAKHARFWTARGAVRVVRVNIDAMVFSAVRAGRSRPRLQGVFVFSWQLWLRRGPAESAPAAQKLGWRQLFGFCDFSRGAPCPARLLLRTRRTVVFLDRQTVCRESAFCIWDTGVVPGLSKAAGFCVWRAQGGGG